MRELERIVRALRSASDGGESAMLVTVLGIQGSVYRGTGARMVVASGGGTEGAVSGGCLEADIISRMPGVLSGAVPEVVRYDTRTSDDGVLGLGMGCRGVIDLLLEPLESASLSSTISTFERILSRHDPITIATLTRDSGDLRVGARVISSEDGSVIEGDARVLSHEGELVRETIEPALDLLVCGAGADAIPVVALGAEMGWRIRVVDHRESFATRERFPGAAGVGVVNLVERPASLERMAGPHTMAVVMAHSSAHDGAYLKALLDAGARYIGVLGPRRRTLEMLAFRAAHGLPPSVHSPAGLDLGAETPHEIALSIVAEVAAVHAGRTGKMLRDRSGPIHERREQLRLQD